MDYSRVMFHRDRLKGCGGAVKKGHEWQAKIATRVAGSGCPVCAGRKIVPGENDLATMIPDVAAEWLQEKNGAIDSGDVSAIFQPKGLVAMQRGACVSSFGWSTQYKQQRLPLLRKQKGPPWF